MTPFGSHVVPDLGANHVLKVDMLVTITMLIDVEEI